MAILQQVLFVVLFVVAVYLFARKVKEIRANINLGKDRDLTDQKNIRWRNVFLLAFGQKKMFRNPLVGFLHFLVYAGFIIINIEILEIILDGILGTHRLFSEPLGGFYNFVINFFEVLAILVAVSCAVFLIRRNIIRLPRFAKHDLDGWPRTDANAILFTEIVLMTLFIMMNSSDRALQLQGAAHYTDQGNFIVSGLIAPALSGWSESSLITLERTAWWLHIIGILAFLNYLPYSKHLHIILAFPNAYYKPLQPWGEMDNMPNVQKEVLYVFQPELAPQGEQAPAGGFGARDIFDLSWKNLMDAYTCTECGRCTAACPANQTGKLLNPRKIMMDTRDRMEEVRKNINTNGGEFKDDGKKLLHDYITAEELRACVSCNACVQECPVSISPLDIIFQLRRGLIMEESDAPPEWNLLFNNIENNFAPWKFNPDDRDAWTKNV
ncbi:MAG: (Fe-S)-binding protein [Chitinophagaceae bacterium]|nr:(Fe-S)-binding protein [Chitinophagaceae bacterium]